MPDFYRIHVRLLDVKPKLWRRFLIVKDATFMDLHEAIQDACGWENAHMFMFRSADKRKPIAGLPGSPMDEEPDARRAKLSTAFKGKLPNSCLYWYDFGDDWNHEVTAEAIETHEGQFKRRLLEGAGTFPPEDCGGSWGYERCVAAATGKGWKKQYGDEQERREFVEWIGEWMPADFNIVATKRRFDG